MCAIRCNFSGLGCGRKLLSARKCLGKRCKIAKYFFPINWSIRLTCRASSFAECNIFSNKYIVFLVKKQGCLETWVCSDIFITVWNSVFSWTSINSKLLKLIGLLWKIAGKSLKSWRWVHSEEEKLARGSPDNLF